MRCGLLAFLCLAMNTPAIAQTAPTTSGQISPYAVDGLALGARVQSNNSGYREYKCGPSDQFNGFMWCQKTRQQKERRGSFKVTHSLLHSRDGKIVYVNRFQAPAFFGPNEADEDIQRYSRRLGESARITKLPRRAGVPDGILATWGNVELEPLDSASITALGKGSSPRKGYLVDFIGNFARSAKEDLPIYGVSGGAGFIWVASYDQKGRGTLRFAAVNASAFYPELLSATEAGKTQNNDAQQATPDAEPAVANPAGAEVSHQQAEVAVTPNTATEVGRGDSALAKRDPLVAQTEIERLNAERAELGATIRRLEADKAAAEAKAHTFETTVYGAIIVLLLVAAGIGAFVLVVKQKQGQAGDHSSVTLETKKSSAAKPADITETESAIARYPQQLDLKSDHGIAPSVPETKEPSANETIEVTKEELAGTNDHQLPDLKVASIAASSSAPSANEPAEIIKSKLSLTRDPHEPDLTGASVDASSPDPADISASPRGLGMLTGTMIVGTVSAGAIAAVLYAKGPNPYQGGDASRVSETNDSPWEFHAKNNDATNEMEAFVIGWQENGQGAGAEIIGECADRGIIFKATVLGRDATPSVELLWDDKLEDYRNSIGKFMQVIYLPISIRVNDGEAEVTKRLQEGPYRNVIRLATLNFEPTPATRVAQLDNNLSPAERTALASYYPEHPLNIAEVRNMRMQFETSEGPMPVKIMMDDPAIRKFVRACQKR
jgi:hypothetical protein